MHNNVNQLISINKEIQSKLVKLDYKDYNPEVIAVSKTFKMIDILPLINHGHLHFGENKVQESVEKWTDIKTDFPKIQLHMIGKLQTNKVKFVVKLFDYIHSLDSLRLAEKIASEETKLRKKLKIFIQVNIGNEEQKNGIEIENLEKFYNQCVTDLNLQIVGLMCIPPNTVDTEIYFNKMKLLSAKIGLTELSMGMSKDYLQACESKSTFLRIGSKIFGARP